MMSGRTFLRIMLDNLFINNALSKSLITLVNFCKEQSYFNGKSLKFLKKMPLNKIENEGVYKTKFIFNNTQNYGANFK